MGQILMRRRTAASAEWTGPALRFPPRTVAIYHIVDLSRPASARTALREILRGGWSRLHLVFARIDDGNVQVAPGRLLSALQRLAHRVRHEIEMRLRMPSQTVSARESLREVLERMGKPEGMVYAVGVYVVSPVSHTHAAAIRPAPFGVPPAAVLGRAAGVSGMLCGSPSEVGGRLIRAFAEHRLPILFDERPPLEEAPVPIGVDGWGIPVHVLLGREGQAAHLAVLGPTGRGKTVTAQVLIRRAMRLGLAPVILDSKGEMVRDGKGLFGLPVLDPTSPAGGWPAWSLPAAQELLESLRPRLISRDGTVRLRRADVEEALENCEGSMVQAALLWRGLLTFASGGAEPPDVSTLVSAWKAALRRDLSWLSALRENVAEALAARMAEAAASSLTELLGEERASRLIGEDAPYRHLLRGRSASGILRASGAVVSFPAAAAALGPEGDRALSGLYLYVVGALVSAVMASRRRGEESRRWLIYLEEAHRVQELVEGWLRLLRAFSASVLVVTQSAEDLSPGALEQLRYVVLMGPGRDMLASVFSRLGVPYDPEPFVPEAPFGAGVVISLRSGRPSAPRLLHVILGEQEAQDILHKKSASVQI